jgi:4-hydroxy-2-oxoheptanedioate aldolase
MKLPVNTFKHALANKKAQIGLWVGMADPYAIDILATAGFDWLLIDGEHAPNDVRTVLAQLQVLSGYATHAIVRPVEGHTALIKQYLDVGAQTLLVPMVDTAEQARAIVSATRYPPRGIRGVGSAVARASRWNAIPDYVHDVEQELCLLLQVETAKGMANLEEIAQVEGVDGIFFGPADLSASLGFLGNAGAPEVQSVIEAGIATVLRAAKAPGILTSDTTLAKRYLELGALFVAVGVDTSLLASASRSLAARFKVQAPPTASSSAAPTDSTY